MMADPIWWQLCIKSDLNVNKKNSVYVFEVADYEFSIRIYEFKIADHGCYAAINNG